MSKCIERPSNRRGPVPFSNAIDYICPVCDHVSTSQGGCNSHIYKEHNEWAKEDTNKTLK